MRIFALDRLAKVFRWSRRSNTQPAARNEALRTTLDRSAPESAENVPLQILGRLIGIRRARAYWPYVLTMIFLLGIYPFFSDKVYPTAKAVSSSLSEFAPLPKAHPGKFTVAVAHLNNDPEGKYEAIILEDLREIDWLDTLPLNRTISMDPNRFHETDGARSDLAKAREYLRKSRAQVLIWGSVLRTDERAVPDLFLTNEGGEGASEGRFGVTQDLHLPKIFWEQLTDYLDFALASQFLDVMKQQKGSGEALRRFVPEFNKCLTIFTINPDGAATCLTI